MSWRRKALTLSVVLGAGVLSLGPVLSDSISKRIATSWNVDASVSKVEISLPNSRLSLFALDIRRPDLFVHGDEVHLKMNSESLWYRDGIVESMIGKGFLFRAQSTPANTLSLEQTAGSPVAKVKGSFASIESSCKSFEGKIRTDLDLALKQFHDFEMQSQVRTQAIDSRISRLRSELTALQDPNQTPNPLRVTQRFEQLRSEGSLIQQLLAEDRLQRKQEVRACATTMDSLLESIKTFRTTHPVPEIHSPSLIEEILHLSVEDAQRRLHPYTTLLQFSAVSLLDNSSTSIPQEPADRKRIDQDLVTGSLKPRQSKILQGKISGFMEHDGRREPTVVRVTNPPAGSIADRARIQIEWGGASVEGFQADEAMSKTNAVIERLKPDTSSVAIHLSVEQQSNDERITFQSSWDAAKAVSKLQLPTQLVEHQFTALGMIEDSAQGSKLTDDAPIEVTLSSEFSKANQGPDLSAINLVDLGQAKWELRPDQVNSLTTWFEIQWSQSLSRLLEKTEASTKSMVSQESENLQRRAQRIDEVMNQRQAEWNQQLQDLIAQVAEFEGQQLRARSNSSTITR